MYRCEAKPNSDDNTTIRRPPISNGWPNINGRPTPTSANSPRRPKKIDPFTRRSNLHANSSADVQTVFDQYQKRRRTPSDVEEIHPPAGRIRRELNLGTGKGQPIGHAWAIVRSPNQSSAHKSAEIEASI